MLVKVLAVPVWAKCRERTPSHGVGVKTLQKPYMCEDRANAEHQKCQRAGLRRAETHVIAHNPLKASPLQHCLRVGVFHVDVMLALWHLFASCVVSGKGTML
jgi:hypothetical protein